MIPPLALIGLYLITCFKKKTEARGQKTEVKNP